MIEQIDTFVTRDGLALRQRSWTTDVDARAVSALLDALLRDVDRARVETLVIEWMDARLPVQ